MSVIKKFFKTRAAGFYIMLVAVVLALIECIMYHHFYTEPAMLQYYSGLSFALSILAMGFSLAMSLFPPTAKWAALVLYALEFCAFLLFIDSTYLYLTTSMHSGISMEAIFGLNTGFLSSAILHVLIMIVSLVSVFLKSEKGPKKPKKSKPVEVAE